MSSTEHGTSRYYICIDTRLLRFWAQGPGAAETHSYRVLMAYAGVTLPHEGLFAASGVGDALSAHSQKARPLALQSEGTPCWTQDWNSVNSPPHRSLMALTICTVAVAHLSSSLRSRLQSLPGALTHRRYRSCCGAHCRRKSSCVTSMRPGAARGMEDMYCLLGDSEDLVDMFGMQCVGEVERSISATHKTPIS